MSSLFITFTRATVILLCVSHASILRSQTEFSGGEIRARMEGAKKNFYSYTQTEKSQTSDMTMVTRAFAQSRPEGDWTWAEFTVAHDLEPNNATKTITILLGYEKYYLYYPDHHIAADLSYGLPKVKGNTEKAAKEMEGATVTFAPVKEVVYDNADCYELQVTSTKDGKTLAEEHYMIDKKTFLPRLHEGQKRGRPFKTEYQNVRPEPELTTEFFQLPEGVLLKTASTRDEAMVVMREIDLIRHLPPKMETEEEIRARIEAEGVKRRALRAEERKKLEVEIRSRHKQERTTKRQAELDEFMK